ncbi:MAG: NUDIX domain-containing protein [Candidatus Pacebacteria bacterium]|nr:NUDIX domain-containing protein [Candidatus Paceibacterota bacterium]
MKQGTLGIGVGIIIVNKDNKILFGKRVYQGMPCWCLPGGKLEFGESLVDAVVRETKEECNIDIQNPQQISISEGFNHDKNIQFVTIGYMTREFTGTVVNNEPHVFTDWQWFSFDNLPENIFGPSRDILNQYKEPTGR